MRLFSIFTVTLFSSFFCISISSGQNFTDDFEIPQWGKSAAIAVKNSAIMTGFGDGSFAPYRNLNRAEALALILRTKKIDYQNNAIEKKVYFSDVVDDQWYTKIIQNGVSLGYVSGFPDGTFRPGDSVNRAEFSRMIQKAFSLEASDTVSFQDVHQTDWFFDSVSSMASNGLIRNVGARYNPDEKVSRIEAAWIISEILKKPRLMGEVVPVSYDVTLDQKRDSTRVAIKPKNFNPNLQGYIIERKAIHIETEIPSEEKGVLYRDSDWLYVGDVLFRNTLENTSQINSFELKLRFDRTDVGPVSNFKIRVSEVDGNYEKEQDVLMNGTAFLGGITTNIKKDETARFSVWIAPKSEQSFFNGIGEGYISVHTVKGSTFTSFVSERKQAYGQISAPMVIAIRELYRFNFSPISIKNEKSSTEE